MNTDRLVHIAVMGFGVGLIGYAAYASRTGAFRGKYGHIYYREDGPFSFWCVIALNVAVGLLTLGAGLGLVR